MSNFRPNTRKVAFAILDFLKKRPALERRMKSLSDWYCDKMGYRKYGLIKDDLIDDGHDAVQEAIRRLPEQIQLDRMFRLKRAVQSHTNRDILPESEWTPVEKDTHYLLPTLWAVCRERDEKDMFDKLKPNEFSKFLASKRIVNGEMPSVAAAEKSK